MFNALGSRPGIATWAFVVLVAVLLPIAAFRQHQALKAGTLHSPSRTALYAGAVATHGVLLLGVLACALADDLRLFPAYAVDLRNVVASAIALAIGLLLLLERMRATDAVARERTRMIAPRSAREYWMFAGVAASAGFAEQLAYRGVLFSFFLWYTGTLWSAAMLAAIPFGLVHLFQGWRSAIVVMVIALRDQILVALTGTLVFAMAIHIIHDVVAGTVLMRRVRREENLIAVS
jgi:hypothetical protein